MEIRINYIDNYNPKFHYMLIYGDDKYYMHTIDINTSDPINVTKINVNIGEPRHISRFKYSRLAGYWQIVDVHNHIHLLIIEDGHILLKTSVYCAPIGNTLLSTNYNPCGMNEFAMFYIDEDNVLTQQSYDCNPCAPKHHKIIKCGTVHGIKRMSPGTIIDYVCNNMYIKTKNNLYCLLSSNNNMIKVDDYQMQSTGISITYNKNLYVYDICSNRVYKNNKIVHTFTNANLLLEKCHSADDTYKLVLMFVSNNYVTHLTDYNGSITICEFYIGNIKFVNSITTHTLLNRRNKMKERMMTFVLANKITKQKIPRMLIHKIISMIQYTKMHI